VGLASCHPCGAYNFEVVPRFLDKMRTAALSNAYYLNIYLKNGHYSFI
jgi:hypothetical protein